MNAAIKNDPNRLPVPKLPPTRPLKPKVPDFKEAELLRKIERGRSHRVISPVREEEPRPIKRRRKDYKTSKSWKPEEDEQLKKLYLQGLSNGKIADQLHMGKQRVAKRLYSLKRNGSIPHLERRDPRIWKEEEIEKFICLHKAGRTYEEIAAALGKTIGACQTRAWELSKQGRLKMRHPRVQH